MSAANERSVGVDEAISRLRATLDHAGFTCEFQTGGVVGFPVYRCCLRDPAGNPVAYALGKGAGRQSMASVLYELWQHYQHEIGQRSLAARPDAVRVVPVGDVVAQPAVRPETMLHRLAGEYPDARVACLRLTAVGDPGRSVWYPAFARCPSLRWYPVPGDDLGYDPYVRYAYDNGTACAVTEPDALLHGLLEVVERDAVSLALLDWYAADPARARVVPLDTLPDGLRTLTARATGYMDGVPPLLLDVTSDLGVPAFAALPSRATRHVGLLGSGASLDTAYAAERALTELVQCWFTAELDVDATHHDRLAALEPWPVLHRCAVLDPAGLAAAAERVEPNWSGPPDRTIGEQVSHLVDVLAAHGFHAWTFRWNPADTEHPVITVVVPGLDSFAMVHNAVPVLPTGRAMGRLTRYADT
jgi:ribosomal protein S12 methylthiotransferase accessory factor